MAVVLTPILKNELDEKAKMPDSLNTSRVRFNLPEDHESIIQYLKENDEVPFIKKLNSVVKIILSPNTEDLLLRKWIVEFKENILFLSKENEQITFALLNMKWFLKDDCFIAQYQELILNIVTAHPSCLKSVLSMILKLFVTITEDSDDITVEEGKIFSNAHKLLKHITELVPLSQYQLCVMLSERFPYMKNSTHIIHCYVANLLNICLYLPLRRPTILECIVEKLIRIDVNCSRDVIELYEQHQQDDETFMMDQDKNSESVKNNSMAYPLSQTLDVVIDCILKYIQATCFYKSSDTLDWETTKKLYKEVLTVFDKIILPTRGSCHVQYIMFYICSLKQELCDGFLDYLWKKIQNPNIGPVFRQIASFYIGSLLARAKYINISTVTACFDLMCNWIHRYIDNHISQDLSVHGTFHSVCQTVFYVFAFRIKELIELKNGHKYLRSLNFDRIVSCHLNPLRYCDRTIVQNFASVARNYQIAYVYPIIEKNNRNLLYTCWETNAENSAGMLIPIFFPFDPYLLKRSKHWIESLYRIYNHSHKDDEDLMEDEEITVSNALFSYGASPGFKKTFLLVS